MIRIKAISSLVGPLNCFDRWRFNKIEPAILGWCSKMVTILSNQFNFWKYLLKKSHFYILFLKSSHNHVFYEFKRKTYIVDIFDLRNQRLFEGKQISILNLKFLFLKTLFNYLSKKSTRIIIFLSSL